MVDWLSFDSFTHCFFKANPFSNTLGVLHSLTFMMAQFFSKVPVSRLRKPDEEHEELLEALFFSLTSSGTACVQLDFVFVRHSRYIFLATVFYLSVWCLPDPVDVEVDKFHLFFVKADESLHHLRNSTHRKIYTTLEQY